MLLSQDEDICIGRESLAILAAEGAMRRMTIAAGNHRATDGLLKPDFQHVDQIDVDKSCRVVEYKKLFLVFQRKIKRCFLRWRFELERFGTWTKEMFDMAFVCACLMNLHVRGVKSNRVRAPGSLFGCHAVHKEALSHVAAQSFCGISDMVSETKMLRPFDQTVGKD